MLMPPFDTPAAFCPFSSGLRCCSRCSASLSNSTSASKAESVVSILLCTPDNNPTLVLHLFSRARRPELADLLPKPQVVIESAFSNRK